MNVLLPRRSGGGGGGGVIPAKTVNDNDFDIEDDHWANAIKEAAAYGINAHDTKNPALPGSIEEGIAQVERSLSYLEVMRKMLEQQENQDIPPYQSVPPPETFLANGHEEGTGRDPKKKVKKTKRKKSKPKKQNLIIPSILIGRRPKIRNDPFSTNPFAALGGEYDSDDGDSEDVQVVGTNNNDSAPPLIPNLSHPSERSPGMDTIRLLVRLFTSKSDLYAKKARLLSAQRKWLPGAEALQSSIIALSRGVEIAEARISAHLNAMERAYHGDSLIGRDPDLPPVIVTDERLALRVKDDENRQELLEKDAEIASMSAKKLHDQKEQYLKMVQKQVIKLQKVLEPMWKARDDARKEIGERKWKYHRNPGKGRFAEQRRKYEQELEMIEKATKQLSESSSFVADAGKQLLDKIRLIRYTKNRYNRRPSKLITGTNNILIDYDWTFTGSLDGTDCVEFYEKWFQNESMEQVLVKIDCHFQTNTIRSVIEYPAKYNINGDVMLPARKSIVSLANHTDLTAEVYRTMLTDPLDIHRRYGVIEAILNLQKQTTGV